MHGSHCRIKIIFECKLSIYCYTYGMNVSAYIELNQEHSGTPQNSTFVLVSQPVLVALFLIGWRLIVSLVLCINIRSFLHFYSLYYFILFFISSKCVPWDWSDLKIPAIYKTNFFKCRASGCRNHIGSAKSRYGVDKLAMKRGVPSLSTSKRCGLTFAATVVISNSNWFNSNQLN